MHTRLAALFLALVSQARAEPSAFHDRYQEAVSLLAQGETARHEHEVRSLPADSLDSVRQSLRLTVNLLEALDKNIQSELPLRRRAVPRPGEPTIDDLSRLRLQVQHQLARAHKNRALLYVAGSDDRLSLLLASADILKRLAPQVPDSDPLKSMLQLDLAECQRLLGRFTEAAEQAAALDRDGRPDDVRQRARAELIRASLGQDDLPTVRRLIGNIPTSSAPSSPELDLARFEALLALAKTAGGGQANQYQNQAAEIVSSLEHHGAYWNHRAMQFLITAFPRGKIVNLQLLSRAADGWYLQGDVEQAFAAYDDAATLAKGQNDSQQAFELTCKAALVEQTLGRHLPVATRLRSLSTSQPSHPQAARAHLLAAWNAAQVAKQDASAAALHEQLLREHLAKWPTAESADQALIWLGAVCESKQDWAEAKNAYSRVSTTSPHHPDAVTALIRCARQLP